ncbi:hypothetical protein MLD38_030342 [Melastoma candidum]|uniref:Uncharacterized protein n=1 Tax=Melastoma candidum TaxID=119954 RepID=A0ACB9MLJ7_9MYRT|nr:hypothetical protein MLD38_030342 [Melastoma candidum]
MVEVKVEVGEEVWGFPGKWREVMLTRQPLRSSVTFVAGTICGIYIAQNYSVPSINKLAGTALFMASLLERSYRKPDKDD